MNKRERRPKDIGFYILVLVVLVAVIFLMTSNRETDPMNMTYSQVRDLFRNNQVSSFVLEGDSLILTLKRPIDAVTVLDEMKRQGGFDPQSAQAYLVELMSVTLPLSQQVSKGMP